MGHIADELYPVTEVYRNITNWSDISTGEKIATGIDIIGLVPGGVLAKVLTKGGKWILRIVKPAEKVDDALPLPLPVPVELGVWVPSNEVFSGISKAYQEWRTGRPISEAYIVNGKKFDDYRNGELVDEKANYDDLMWDKKGNLKNFRDWENYWRDQAAAQTRAAGDTPILWEFMTPKAQQYVKAVLGKRYPNIRVEYVPMP